jgi:uncharacterized iron-regulated membrane protein
MTRRVLVVVHRWCGLFTAVFLFVAGLTGAVIAWDQELDAWLNPQLFEAAAGPLGEPLAALALVRRVESAEPHAHVRYAPLTSEPSRTLLMSVEPRVDPQSGRPYVLAYNQVAVDPQSGAIQGRRTWGQASLARENLLPFLYSLHYSLHLPELPGLGSGVVLMGMVAVVWALDCFVALWLSFPSLKTWRRSFAFRLRQGGAKRTFDLHRSSGVWVWALLLTMAVTAVSMNLRDELVRPLVSWVSHVQPSVFDVRPAASSSQVSASRISREQALSLALAEARRRGIAAPAGGIVHEPERRFYGIGFFVAGQERGTGLGNPWLYIDADDGSVVGADVPGTGSAGDLFLQAQYPIHSGRVAGLLGRIAISALGLVIAMLSVTGVVLWAKKRHARARSLRRVARAHVGASSQHS